MSNTKNLANLAAALDDGTSGQVLQSTGSGGVQFADSTGSGVTVHANQAAMLTDAASASEGTLHYETDNNKLYVKQSSGFYLLASITNVAPTIDSFSENTGGAGANNLTSGGTFTLTVGSNTVVTINATEPDLETISYSATVTSGTATDVFSSPSFPVSNQSSNVFTLTPVTSGTGGTVTIRFDASDGTNVANVTHSFSIVFAIADSHYTSLLVATDAASGDNNDITDSSSNTYTITASGDARAGTFSPYRHGGYSTYFDGSGDDLTIADHTSFDFGTGDFTVETWFYLASDDGTYNICAHYSSGNNGGIWLGRWANGFVFRQAGVADVITASSPPSANEWHHVAVSRSSGSTRMFIDGTQVGSTVTSDTNNYSASAPFTIGHDGSTVADQRCTGYVSDFRIVKGTGVYTGNFSPPTERLTDVSGTGYSTSLLTCHLPYISDGSSNNHTITVNGNTTPRPFGPYDYDEYSESINGGSVYFDGDGDYLGTPNITMLATDQTVEFWAWHEGTDGDGVLGSISDVSFTIALDTGKPYIWVNNQTLTNISGYTISSGHTATGNAAVSNGWHHYAYDINVGASTTTLITYVDGAVYGSLSWANASLTARGVGRALSSPVERYFVGYISDLRVVNSRVYTAAFDPPTAPLSAITNTSLLLSGTDAHVLDKSQGNNLKLVGNAAAVTNATNNSNISSTNAVYFGGSGDRLELESLDDLSGGPWTIEGWYYFTTDPNSATLLLWSLNDEATNGYAQLNTLSSGNTLQVQQRGTSTYTSSGTYDFDVDTWYHIAAVWDGTNQKVYVDGTAVISSTTNVIQNAGNGLTLNGDGGGSYSFSGYIQDFRITKGLARYTSNFTVPSAPLKG